MLTEKEYRSQEGDNRFYVYVHRKASDNKPFYVGKGQKERAWWKHNRNPHWNNVVNKHGLIIDVIFDNLTEDEAFQIEIDTILEFEYFGYKLVNMTKGGDGPAGRTFSEETREKMSLAQKTSEKVREARKKVSEARRGVKVGPRPATSKALKGKPKSEAHRLAAQAAKRCKNVYTFQNVETLEHFTGTRYDFQVHLGVVRSKVSNLFGNRPVRVSNGWRLLSPPNNLQIINKEK